MQQLAIRLHNGRFRLLEGLGDQVIAWGHHVVYETQDGLWCDKAYRLPTVLVIERNNMEKVKFIRMATSLDLKQLEEKKQLEHQAMRLCKEKIIKHGLPMKLATAAYTFDYRRLTFFFSANGRVDFRELLKDLTKLFPRVRLMLRQMGARHEAGLLGGVGPCGRELCCSTFLNEFESITLQLATDQDLPPNPARLSGNCGRLKCCLRYEQDYYLFLKERMPALGSQVYQGEQAGKVIRHLVMSNSLEVLVGGKFQTWPLDQVQLPASD